MQYLYQQQRIIQLKTLGIMSNLEILNKGCDVKFGTEVYHCYNETSLMHFVKRGAKGQLLKPNSKNLMSLKKEQVLRFIKIGSATIEVGNIKR